MHYFLLTIFCMDIFLGTLVDFRAINLLGKFSYVWNLEKLGKKRLKKKWYFVSKIVLIYCEKKMFSVQEKLLKFEAKGWEFAMFLRSLLKYGFQKKISFCCRCSNLSPTFAEMKNSFTRTLLTFNSKKFGIICYRKNADENEPI